MPMRIKSNEGHILKPNFLHVEEFQTWLIHRAASTTEFFCSEAWLLTHIAASPMAPIDPNIAPARKSPVLRHCLISAYGNKHNTIDNNPYEVHMLRCT